MGKKLVTKSKIELHKLKCTSDMRPSTSNSRSKPNNQQYDLELDDVQVILDEKGRVVRTSKYHPNKSRELLILDDSVDDQMKAEKPKRTREEKPILKTSNNPLKQCSLLK